MKRKISIFLSAIMLIMAMIPAQVFAESDNGLEKAIKTVKGMFTVPDSYTEFNYNISTYGGEKLWHLNWNSKDGMEGGLNVSINEEGNIINYGNYKPYNYSNQKKIAKVSKQQAKAIADEFIKKVNPGISEQLKYQDNFYNSINDYEYYLNYTRVVDGQPYYSNTVGISIDKQAGEVRNYNCNWDKDLTFPSVKGAISTEKAQQAFKDKMGLELKYNYTYEGDKIKVFPAYMPKYKYNTYIDALTGEKVELNNYYGPYDGYYGAAREKMDMRYSASVYGGGGPVLTEEELKAVDNVSKLISKEEAEKIARGIKVLELSDEFKARNYNLSKAWPDRSEFVWNVEFVKESTDQMENRYVNVSINAATGSINGFNTYFPHKDGETANYDETAAKTAAESLLKELQPEKFNESFYNDINNYNPIPYMSKTLPTYYNFSYSRKVNGIPFEGNSLNVGYDAVIGKITSFNVNWFNIEFPAVEKAIELEQVYDKLFSEIGMEMQYVGESKKVEDAKIIYDGGKPELNIRLVYGLKPSKPVIFDAYTGEVLDYSGKAYKDTKPAEYSDIAGNFAEEPIKILAENGIYLEGKEFKPDEKILQKEFFGLLSKSLNYYGSYMVTKGDKELEDLYAFLIREGIVKEGEKAPDSSITNEDAAKFIIRAMKLEKAAAIQGIYKCDFKDADQVAPELLGYVVIAEGLGIVTGSDGSFNPKAEITRAQAACILYNYLKN